MSSIDWLNGKPADQTRTAARTTTPATRSLTPTKSGQKSWGLSPQKVEEEPSPRRDELDLKKLHPEGITKQELMHDSPKRWDMLHQFDKTKHQTKEFLRQALQEEMEYDPECTFQPQISEMSELLMRKYARYDFHERNRMWSTRKETRIEKLRDTRVDQENYPFTPSIIKEPPKFKEGVLEKKQGVQSYLDRIHKQKTLKERDEFLRERRRPKSTLR